MRRPCCVRQALLKPYEVGGANRPDHPGSLDKTGVVTLRHNSRLHHVGIGRRHLGRRVLVLVKDLHIRVLTDPGEPLRELHLDTSRDYQPRPRA